MDNTDHPHMAVKVSPPYPYLPTLHCPLPSASPFGRIRFIVRPRPGTATSNRRSHVPRVGSPAYWAPDSSPAFNRGTSVWSTGLGDQWEYTSSDPSSHFLSWEGGTLLVPYLCPVPRSHVSVGGQRHSGHCPLSLLRRKILFKTNPASPRSRRQCDPL